MAIPSNAYKKTTKPIPPQSPPQKRQWFMVRKVKTQKGMEGRGLGLGLEGRTRIRARVTRAGRPSETDDREMRSTAHALRYPHEAAEHQKCQCTLSNACSTHCHLHYCCGAYACST